MRKQISIIARPIWHTRAMYQTSDRTEAEARHSRRYIRENAVNYTTRKIKTCPISHQGLRFRITARHFLIGESFLCHHDLICRWFADLQSCVPLPESSLTTTINYTRIYTREKAYVRTTFTYTHTHTHWLFPHFLTLPFSFFCRARYWNTRLFLLMTQLQHNQKHQLHHLLIIVL